MSIVVDIIDRIVIHSSSLKHGATARSPASEDRRDMTPFPFFREIEMVPSAGGTKPATVDFEFYVYKMGPLSYLGGPIEQRAEGVGLVETAQQAQGPQALGCALQGMAAFHSQGVRTAPVRARQVARPSTCVASVAGTHSERDARLASLRQPALLGASSFVSRDPAGQHARRYPQGASRMAYRLRAAGGLKGVTPSSLAGAAATGRGDGHDVSPITASPRENHHHAA